LAGRVTKGDRSKEGKIAEIRIFLDEGKKG
jgi:hypothetical protein